jgi:hypothetical protein
VSGPARPYAGIPTPRLVRAVARAAPTAGAYRHAPAAAAVLAGATGVGVLVGWAFDLPALGRRVPGLLPMVPNTAVVIALLAAALWLQRPDTGGRPAAGAGARRAGRAAAAAALVLTLVVGAEWASGRALGVDLVLFPEAVRRAQGAAPIAGRMALNTVFAAAALALALLLTDAALPPRGSAAGRLLRWVRGASTAVGTLAPYFALVGYAYGARRFYEPAGLLAGMALHTAVALTAVGVGVTLARPERGLARLLTADDAGGLLLRGTLPVAITVPALLGLLRLAGEARGWWTDRVGTAGLVLAFTLVMGHTLVRAAVRVRAVDAERARSLAAARAQAKALAAAARAREATAAALAAREAEFRAMADNIPQLAWMTTTRGGSSGTTRAGTSTRAPTSPPCRGGGGSRCTTPSTWSG